MHFRNKKKQYLKDKIDEFATNSKNKSIRDLYENTRRGSFAETKSPAHKSYCLPPN
jgi:hypothetical protein